MPSPIRGRPIPRRPTRRPLTRGIQPERARQCVRGHLAARCAQQRGKRPRARIAGPERQHAIDRSQGIVIRSDARTGIGERLQARDVLRRGFDDRSPLRDRIGGIAELPCDLAEMEAGVDAIGHFAQRAAIAQQCIDRPTLDLMPAAAREPLSVALEIQGRLVRRAFSALITRAGPMRSRHRPHIVRPGPRSIAVRVSPGASPGGCSINGGSQTR